MSDDRHGGIGGLLYAWSRVWAIALNTFREATRNRVLYVLVLFAIGLMGFSIVLGELSLHEEVRVIKDIGLAGISLVGLVIALFLGVNLLSKELDRKTVFFVIPKPLFRHEFLLGKFVGLAVTLLVLVVLMATTLALVIASEGGHHDIALVRAELLVLFELWLVTAVALLFSSFSSPYLSAMFTASLWVIGRNSGELRAFAGGKLAGTPLGHVLDGVTVVLPDFHAFFVSGAMLGGETPVSIHEAFVSWGYVAQAGLYAASYGGMCLVIACLLFLRRDFT
jgi:ABC-type transport system involved in multi-copper enzyme maturation permease subunit